MEAVDEGIDDVDDRVQRMGDMLANIIVWVNLGHAETHSRGVCGPWLDVIENKDSLRYQ